MKRHIIVTEYNTAWPALFETEAGKIQTILGETLVGTEFYAPRGVLPELKTEEVYYEADLVGMKVLDAKKAEVAEVVGFYNFGAGDILEIRLKSGRSEMLPFNKGYVPEINLDEGYIIVASTGMVFLEDGEDSEEC